MSAEAHETNRLQVLLVENDPADAELVLKELSKAGYQLATDAVDRKDRFQSLLVSKSYDVIISDYRLNDWTGLDALAVLKDSGKDIPFILVTGTLGEDRAVECIKQGVTDYVLKDQLARLPLAVRRALDESVARRVHRASVQAMLHSEERYRTLVNISPDAIFVHVDGALVFANPACVRLFGAADLEQIVGRPIFEIVDPAFHDTIRNRIRACLEHGQPAPPLFEIWNRIDGKPVDVEVTGSACTWKGRPAMLVVARDITERRLSEEALRRSEERYRLMFEQSPQPMWVYHVATLKFLGVNQAAVEHYGWSRNEFLGMTLRDIRPAEDVSAMEASIVQATAPIDQAGVWRHRTKYGRTLYVEVREGHVEYEGKAARLVLAYDVTERIAAEEKLRLQATALQSAANAIIITNAQGEIQSVNPALERLTGYSSAEIVGRSPKVLQSGHHDRAFYKQMWDTILAGKVWEGDVVNRRKSGEVYTEHMTITPVRNTTGEITNFVGIKQDVTAIRAAQDALRRSEAENRSVIENAPYGVFRVRDDGHVLMVNPALVRMLGYNSPEELVGRNTATDFYLSREDRERLAPHWQSANDCYGLEATWKRKDGKHIQVRLAGRLLPEVADDMRLYELFVEDITERRSLEEQFRQAQKMEAVGRLAGGIAHDFNNLLMIISSYAELLVDTTSKDTPVERYANQIRDASSRAASVTQQLLAFSRKQVLSPSVLDLNTVVSDLGKMLPRLLGEDVEIVNALAPGLARVKVDRGQMDQIIMNLAVNARDAMPNGGKLVIETSNVHVDESHARQHPTMVPGDYVVMAVSDTGTGMAKEIADHIFEPFFTTKDPGKGTGLGLATVYGIVKQSGGFIWVYSEPGVGTTFKIYLPQVDEEPSKSLGESLVTEAPGGNERILVVEDESGLRVAICEFLAAKGYSVIEALNGADALATCRDRGEVIDLMLTDVVMPGIGGIELAKTAAEFRPHMKVIYMSGYSDRTIDVAAFRRGGVLLQKPFGLDMLAQKLRLVLDDGTPKVQQAHGPQ